MKSDVRHTTGGKLRALFCLFLAVILAGGIVLNGAAANTEPAEYDVKVDSCYTHTAALSGSDLYVWGDNDNGQLTLNKYSYSASPVKAMNGVKDVAVSDRRTLVVKENGDLLAYGRDPATENTLKGKKLASGVVQAAASDSFAAYVSKDGGLYTWGLNDCNQLGNGDTKASQKPVKILDGVTKVALGDLFGLALKEDGTVYAWGANSYLQTGCEDETSVPTPVQVLDGADDIAAGVAYSCVLKKDGSLWTSGDNSLGQLGIGDSIDYQGFTQVLTGVRSVSAGSSHCFAITKDGAVYSWGSGISGQLGLGEGQQQDSPTETGYNYVQVFACNDNTFAIASDGSLFSFGENINYRLGKSIGSDSAYPVRILDKEMNWVYNEEEDLNLDHALDGPETSAPAGSESSEPDETEPSLIPFVNGYSDGTFQPNKKVTRAEFAKMLSIALCEDFDPDENYGTVPFSDVQVNDWYGKYLAYAWQKGFATGYDDGTFKPNDPITRAEAAKLTFMVLGTLDGEKAPNAGFSDVPADYWAAPYINALTQNGALTGYSDGTFRPKNGITRAEATKMVSMAADFRPTKSEIETLTASMPNPPFKDVSSNAWYYVYLLRATGRVK